MVMKKTAMKLVLAAWHFKMKSSSIFACSMLSEGVQIVALKSLYSFVQKLVVMNFLLLPMLIFVFY
jgi:hypothetical protein